MVLVVLVLVDPVASTQAMALAVLVLVDLVASTPVPAVPALAQVVPVPADLVASTPALAVLAPVLAGTILAQVVLVPADPAGITPVLVVLVPAGDLTVPVLVGVETPAGVPVLALASAQAGVTTAVGDVLNTGACLVVDRASLRSSSRSRCLRTATSPSVRVTS